MRGFFGFGGGRRNAPYRLTEQHPVERKQSNDTGDAGKDGYSVLARASVEAQGCRPVVGGEPVYEGPDQSFEQ